MSVIEQIGGRDRCLAIVELGKGDLGVGVDEGLLINAPNSLEIANIERVLGAAVPGMLALELAMGLLFSLGFFQRHQSELPIAEVAARKCVPMFTAWVITPAPAEPGARSDRGCARLIDVMLRIGVPRVPGLQ